jgi:hypothetical protein
MNLPSDFHDCITNYFLPSGAIRSWARIEFLRRLKGGSAARNVALHFIAQHNRLGNLFHRFAPLPALPL